MYYYILDMSSINFKQLMKEYSLEIDDIRWYKSWVMMRELLSFDENEEDLLKMIWSGKLAENLHDMEEKFIEEMQDQIDRDLMDETDVREILADAYALKNKRSWDD